MLSDALQKRGWSSEEVSDALGLDTRQQKAKKPMIKPLPELAECLSRWTGSHHRLPFENWGHAVKHVSTVDRGGFANRHWILTRKRNPTRLSRPEDQGQGGVVAQNERWDPDGFRLCWGILLICPKNPRESRGKKGQTLRFSLVQLSAFEELFVVELFTDDVPKIAENLCIDEILPSEKASAASIRVVEGLDFVNVIEMARYGFSKTPKPLMRRWKNVFIEDVPSSARIATIKVVRESEKIWQFAIVR
ncbi:50S ribosomal protein L12 [Striga asiatica]|uniref:50S ribosomal protein L12 n=1 Tax=Striga asiatica TaxID=4170 RepID=A0A5A7RJ84_STRAF|nr:50S ribosomal protein L12 [Striga asiatica]